MKHGKIFVAVILLSMAFGAAMANAQKPQEAKPEAAAKDSVPLAVPLARATE